MAAIKISLVADVRSFISSFKKGAESVEDIGDELEDLSKQGDQTARSIVDNYEDIARAARDTQKASSKIGDGADESVHRVAKTTGEFKDEAKQNFGEVASSFSGDMSSAADLVQGTLGGLASSLSGPLGLALGAASIALGLFIADAQAAAEKAEELRTEAIDAVSEALDAGIDPQVFVTNAEHVADAIRELDKVKANPKRWFWEEDPSKLEEWEAGLKALGRPTSDIERVLSSSTPTLKAYTKAIEAQVSVLEDRRNAAVLLHSQETSESSRAAQDRAVAELEAGRDVLKNLNEQIDMRDQVASAADRQAQAGVDAALAQIDAEERQKASIEELSSAWQNAATAWTMLTNSVANLKPKVAPVADTTKAAADIKAVADKKYEAKITAKAETAAASQALSDLASRNRTATINVSANLSGATEQIRNYRPATLYIPAILVKPGTRQPI